MEEKLRRTKRWNGNLTEIEMLPGGGRRTHGEEEREFWFVGLMDGRS